MSEETRQDPAPETRFAVLVRGVSLLTATVGVVARTEEDARAQALAKAKAAPLGWWDGSHPQDVQVEGIDSALTIAIGAAAPLDALDAIGAHAAAEVAAGRGGEPWAGAAPHGLAQAVASGAGYAISAASGPDRVYIAGPDGEFLTNPAGCGSLFSSEREAWAAAYAHHMARTPAPGEFTRAIEAGYTVEGVLDNGPAGFMAYDPEGEELASAPYSTERAAWEACDRHRTGATPTTRAAVSGDDFPV